MGCEDWIADPIGTALDIKGPATLTQPWEWGNLGADIKSDWSKLKHLLVADMRRDRETMTNSALTARRMVYGWTRLSGQLAYAESTGDQSQYLHLIVLLAACPLNSMGGLTLDDRPVADFGDSVTYQLFDGTQTEAYFNLVVASGAKWTLDHKLLGCAYVYLRLTYDEVNFSSGLPVVKIEVSGKYVYDPRTGTTLYSSNPALCIRDYMLLPEELGGMGCEAGEIDDASIIAAANICDEMVYDNAAGTNLIRRYSCNGTFNIDSTPKKILDALLQSMSGTALYFQGKWQLFAGAADSLAGIPTLDESWLNGGISFKLGANKGEKINTIKGTFVDPGDHWASKGFPPMTSAAYIVEDGNEELAQDLTLNFTIYSSMAQRLAKIILEKSRRGLVVDYPCNLKAFKLTPYQLVYVNNSLLGWAQKLFRVLDWDFSGTGGVKLTLGEEDLAIYGWDIGEVIELAAVPLTNLPTPWVVAAPSGITCSEELYATNVPGVIKSRALISWSGAAPQITHFDVEKWGPLDSAWHSAGITPNATYIDWDTVPGLNRYRITAVNSLPAKSNPVEASFTLLGKTAPPAAVTGLSAELTRGQMRIYWSANSDLDIAGYELQLGTVWNGSGNTILVRNYAGTSYNWTPTTSGNIQLLIKAIDTTGHYSTSAAALTYTIAAPGPVTGLTQHVIDNIVELHWTVGSVGSFPIDYYELWKGSTFASAVLIGRKYGTFDLLSESLGGTYKYWVRVVDVAGLMSPETGVYAAVNQPPDYVLINDQNLVFSACTLTNAIVENEQILLPVNLTITWDNDFINNPDTTLEPWDTLQDQIDDGYTLYAQPAPATALIERVIDYGALIPNSKLTLGITRLALAGTVTFTPEILVSTDGSAYTSLGAVYEATASSFRYVKYRLSAATSDGGLVSIQQINVKLDVKQKTYVSNNINVTDTTGDGTQVTFASLGITGLVDVVGITAEAPFTNNATNDPIQVRVNLADVPNQTAFKILAWNKPGTRVAVNGVTVSIRYI
ncbi:MAG: hypothetical protein H7Y05_14215 [Steroidobacteraceae bacterium]|nr:hypothetical protein [Deltaproteobacteria bacterium]